MYDSTVHDVLIEDSDIRDARDAALNVNDDRRECRAAQRHQRQQRRRLLPQRQARRALPRQLLVPVTTPTSVGSNPPGVTFYNDSFH